jgi:hemerythrin-like domain-containing protein
MRQLIADHRNFVQFLDILEGQAGYVDAGAVADVEIIEAVLGYLQRYGDQCHHPREDLLYRKVRETDAQLAPDAAALEREHAKLGRDTLAVLTVVRAASDGDPYDALALSSRLTTYVHGYRRHFQEENEGLFRVAADCLGPTDWADLEDRARRLRSAERARSIQERFLALRDYIHRLARLREGSPRA